MKKNNKNSPMKINRNLFYSYVFFFIVLGSILYYFSLAEIKKSEVAVQPDEVSLAELWERPYYTRFSFNPKAGGEAISFEYPSIFKNFEVRDGGNYFRFINIKGADELDITLTIGNKAQDSDQYKNLLLSMDWQQSEEDANLVYYDLKRSAKAISGECAFAYAYFLPQNPEPAKETIIFSGQVSRPKSFSRQDKGGCALYQAPRYSYYRNILDRMIASLKH